MVAGLRDELIETPTSQGLEEIPFAFLDVLCFKQKDLTAFLVTSANQSKPHGNVNIGTARQLLRRIRFILQSDRLAR